MSPVIDDFLIGGNCPNATGCSDKQIDWSKVEEVGTISNERSEYWNSQYTEKTYRVKGK
jgi:uncharacterized protein YifN (PemK superfamily)